MKSSGQRTTHKPSKPTTIDCDNDHKVISQDDKNVQGVLRVQSCHATRFERKPERTTNVGNQLKSLLNQYVSKRGVKDQFDLSIVKTSGDKTYTEFTYTLPCNKDRQPIIIDSLKDACKDKTLTDTVTNENQPDDDDSSSESDEDVLSHTTKATQGTKGTPGTKGTVGTKASSAMKGSHGTKGSPATKGTRSEQQVHIASPRTRKAPQVHTATEGTKGSQRYTSNQRVLGRKSEMYHTPLWERDGTKGTSATKGTEGTTASHVTKDTDGTTGTHAIDGTEGYQSLYEHLWRRKELQCYFTPTKGLQKRQFPPLYPLKSHPKRPTTKEAIPIAISTPGKHC